MLYSVCKRAGRTPLRRGIGDIRTMERQPLEDERGFSTRTRCDIAWCRSVGWSGGGPHDFGLDQPNAAVEALRVHRTAAVAAEEAGIAFSDGDGMRRNGKGRNMRCSEREVRMDAGLCHQPPQSVLLSCG